MNEQSNRAAAEIRINMTRPLARLGPWPGLGPWPEVWPLAANGEALNRLQGNEGNIKVSKRGGMH
jgi:hypothetical protein